MEISYRNSFGDFLQFGFYQTFRSKIILISLAFVLFAVGRLAFDVARTIDFSIFGKILTFSIVLAGGFIAFLLFLAAILLISALASSIARKGKSGECKIQVTENGLIVESSVARSDIKWSGINSIKQTNKFILIYLTKRMAFVVPKRVFASETDANNFFSYIKDLWATHKH